jgi:hypothetical protein
MASGVGGAPLTMTGDQLKALIDALAPQGAPVSTAAALKPRVGGKNTVGSWTGSGAQGLGLHPKSGLCMRHFNGSELKAFQALNAVEEKCKAGLQSKGELVFGLPGETHYDKGALLLREMDDYLTNHGMEPVFQIVQSNGIVIDMLKQPGFVSTQLVESWIEDLTKNGVHDGQGSRHDLCPYDTMNLQFSFQAVLNSCSAQLRQDLLNNLAPNNHTGPQALMLLLTKVYPSSYTKVRGLIQELEKLNIKEVPGENITTLVQKASDLIREIQMNFLRQDQIPDLCVSALKAFKPSSHEFVRFYVTEKMLKVNKLIMSPGSAALGSSTNVTSTSGATMPDDLDPLKMLQGIEELYITLKQQNNYPPGEQPVADKKLSAMQGEVKKLKKQMAELTQDRSASSTGGGGGSSKGPVKNKKGELVECYKCKGNHYKKDCPELAASDTEATSDTSSSNSSRRGSKKGKRSPKKDSDPKLAGSGLTHEVDKKTSDAIKIKLESMPARENVPDDAKYTITIDGNVTAKYCRHHGKFMRGKAAHFTADCRLPEERRVPFQARAAGNMASASPEASPSPSPAPSLEPSGPANHHLIQCSPRTYYDFSNMHRIEAPETNLAVIEEDDLDSDEEEVSFGGWFQTLSKDYGGHSA